MSGKQFWVYIISGAQSGQKVLVVNQLTIGRSNNNNLQFTGPEGGLVSSNHAILKVIGDELEIEDLNSRNGTFINGEKITQCKIDPDQIISFGYSGPKIRIVTQTVPSARPSQQKTPEHNPDKAISNKPFYSDSQSDLTFSGVLEQQTQEEPTVPQPESQSTPQPPSDYQAQGQWPDMGNVTMGLTHKFGSEGIDPEELKDILKNKGRADRMLASGQLSQKDLRMLRSAVSTYSSSKKQWILWGSILGALALITIVILGWQNLSYRKQIEQQTDLVQTIELLENRLENQKEENPSGPPDDQRALLVAKLRAAERQLRQVQQNIRSKDLVTLYKNPLGQEIHRIMEQFGKKNYVVPDLFIQQVEKHIKSFSRRTRNGPVARGFKNLPKYEKMIKKELLLAGMPEAFLYLAVHESALEPTIVSHAGARGLWQFMPATGRRFGLKVPKNWRDLPPEQDERTNPEKATKAAIRYLKGLIAELGDAALAMAAYNAGEGRIRGALRKLDDPINNRDFWYIYRMGVLASETNEYVPKIIATIILDKNRQKYGFDPKPY